jgi:hypothetical protein
MFFSQLKHYIKLDSPLKFNELKKSIKNSLKKIKKKHYKNYFLYSLRDKEIRRIRKAESTLKRKLKHYKK